jgi:hypothetical protein
MPTGETKLPVSQAQDNGWQFRRPSNKRIDREAAPSKADLPVIQKLHVSIQPSLSQEFARKRGTEEFRGSGTCLHELPVDVVLLAGLQTQRKLPLVQGHTNCKRHRSFALLYSGVSKQAELGEGTSGNRERTAESNARLSNKKGPTVIHRYMFGKSTRRCLAMSKEVGGTSELPGTQKLKSVWGE